MSDLMAHSHTSLYEVNPTGRFTDRAEDYRKYRPSYPDAAIHAILQGFHAPGGLVAADVGAGTGISTRQLAERGVRVIAVEPNRAMRDSASVHEKLDWRAGSAEETGLGSAGVDLVLCAHAFHWFRQRSVMEFHRILRPGGTLALMWNIRDGRDPATKGYIEAIHSVNGEHPAELREFAPEVVHLDGYFTPPELRTFSHHQDPDCEGLIGRALSASYVTRDGPAAETLKDLLKRLFLQFQDNRGLLTLVYLTKVYLSQRAAKP
jgi:SAM-dependent methyltransferase